MIQKQIAETILKEMAQHSKEAFLKASDEKNLEQAEFLFERSMAFIQIFIEAYNNQEKECQN